MLPRLIGICFATSRSHEPTSRLSLFAGWFRIVWCALFLVLIACGGDPSSDQRSAPQTSEPGAGSESSAAVSGSGATVSTVSDSETIETTATTASVTENASDSSAIQLSYRYPEQMGYHISLEEITTTEIPPLTEDGDPDRSETSAFVEGVAIYRGGSDSDANTTTIQVSVTITDGTDLDNLIDLPYSMDLLLVVDQQGNLLQISSATANDEEMSIVNALYRGTKFTWPLGPTFPDHPLHIGDTWTEQIEEPGWPGMEPIVTNVDHRLAAINREEDRTIAVIESQMQSEAIEYDLSAQEEDEPSIGTDRSSNAEPSRDTTTISIAPIIGSATYHFDLETGLLVGGEKKTLVDLIYRSIIYDENGEILFDFATSISTEQRGTFQLIDESTASTLIGGEEGAQGIRGG